MVFVLYIYISIRQAFQHLHELRPVSSAWRKTKTCNFYTTHTKNIIRYQINSLCKNSCLAHRVLTILTFNLCSKENLHEPYHELRTWILHYIINEYIKLLKPCYITVDCYFSRWRGFQHSLISMAANKTFL